MCAQTIADGRMPDMDQADGWLHVSKTDRAAALQDDAELHRSLGADVEFWPASLVRSKLKSDTYFQAVHFPTAFSIHPLNYALGLAELAEQAGARIFENTAALSIDPAGVRKRIETASGRVRAAHIVIAGNTHLGKLTPTLVQDADPDPHLCDRDQAARPRACGGRSIIAVRSATPIAPTIITASSAATA